MSKVYLAGAIRGIKDYHSIFARYEEQLINEGHSVFNPAEKEEQSNDNECNLEFRRKVFLLDTDFICSQADVVAVIPNWEKSLGVQAEIGLARAIGLEVRFL